MYYNRLFFSIYKKNLPLIYIVDYIEFNVLEKNMITFDIFVDNKSKVINFCNIFYAFKLKYNLFLINIIEKVSYLILTKKKNNSPW